MTVYKVGIVCLLTIFSDLSKAGWEDLFRCCVSCLPAVELYFSHGARQHLLENEEGASGSYTRVDQNESSPANEIINNVSNHIQDLSRLCQNIEINGCPRLARSQLLNDASYSETCEAYAQTQLERTDRNLVFLNSGSDRLQGVFSVSLSTSQPTDLFYFDLQGERLFLLMASRTSAYRRYSLCGDRNELINLLLNRVIQEVAKHKRKSENSSFTVKIHLKKPESEEMVSSL